MYCTTDQLIVWFTRRELVERTDRAPHTGDINQPVLDAAIAAAGKKIDGYLRAAYPLPLADDLIAGSGLSEVCGDIVRYSLYKGVTNEEVSARYKDALMWLRDVQAKRVTLGALDNSAAKTGASVVRAGVSRIGWENY